MAMAADTPPSQGLLRDIERDLRFWNVGTVDYQSLTRSQATALYLKLQNSPSRFSQRAFIFRQELKTILRWDGSEVKSF
jgi:hypothetical protein